jgi:crotonobetaine/carnitine-CoA ligase
MSGSTIPANSLKTFDKLWRKAVVDHPHDVFLLFSAADGRVTQWSYQEFDSIVRRTAGTLAELGLTRGDTAHLVLRNCPAFIAVWLACARIGATFVPVDPASSIRDLRSQIERVQPGVAICAGSRASDYVSAMDGLGDRPVLEMAETPTDVVNGAPLVSGDSGAFDGTPPQPADRLAIMFTSGTTSAPKGVVLTQQNYWTVGEVMSREVALDSDHRWLVALPLFHANAQYYCFAPAINVGASVALTHTFSASGWVQQVADLRATHASLFAAPIRMILARTAASTPSAKLQHVWFAQSLGREHYERFTLLAGTRPRQLYGMTETIACVTADVSDPLGHDVIGRPVADRVIRVETGEAGSNGEPGMLWVRGKRGEDLFCGYLDDEATTGRAFTKEAGWDWFKTGDLVLRDESGSLRFVGRADDVIKVSGENVSLSEVEAVVAQAPGVFEACVIGKSDPVRDVVPIAFIVASDPDNLPSTADLDEFASGNLTPQSRPREWHFVDSLPRTSVGKVRRFVLGADIEESGV